MVVPKIETILDSNAEIQRYLHNVYTVEWENLVGENFDKFGGSLRIRQSFTCQLLIAFENR